MSRPDRNTFVTLKSGRCHSHAIEGTFLQCQKVVYATYGRANIKQVTFRVDGRWIISPYLVNSLEGCHES